ncbi:leucine-rich repeat receptor-like serine/threonine-protein kinase BAM1 isoform X1 [Musa acuminata AAA Group]|uniref:leucine-rich repeat receptor-like serine/threonine-protein kinase BAM1 isoform X1 n=1 Tax=Musa acuminata AAA Group TaxID=214697 RepID=UPI0031E0B89B
MVPSLLLLALFTVVSPVACASLQNDALVLASVREGFQSSTPEVESWNTADLSSVCSWFGVQCEHGRVVAVDLSNLNISGSVSLDIFGLDSLVNLSLAGNQLQGAIRVSHLPSLRYLNISFNQFDGGLEWDYLGLPNLEVLDAYDNNFTASLPAGVASLKRIKYLDLGGNYFDGEIPASYGRLTTLEYLSLNGNDLRGRIPAELGNLTSLKQLYLGYYNVFDGDIPTELSKLSNLVLLDLSSCGLDGEIPRQIGKLINLETLFLHSNRLSGQIPPSLGNLTRLTLLDLSNNALTGEVPHELAALTQLNLLNLFMNRLHGSIPEFVAELPNLDTLQLFMNNFTGAIPERLGSGGRIRVLDLSSNKLTGAVPANLCPLNQLKVLILLNNFLFGAVPASLGRCSSLTRVRLGQNYLNGSIPLGLLYLPNLNLLELQNNYLSGPVPANDDNSGHSPTQLAELNLSNNLLAGPIPSSISNLSSIQTLLLGNNQLAGPIPSAIGGLRRMVKLDLSRNRLSGSIPPEIGSCTQLTYLDLSQNNLSGPIPPEIAGISILNYLNLSMNHLSDSIPRSIAAMRSLTAADFSFNDLSGELPEVGQLAYMNASSFAGNVGLCGPVLENPCSHTAGRVHAPRSAGDFKLIFALGLLLCSLVFAVAAAVRARSYRRGPGGAAWRLTAFQKVDFGVSDVLECMRDGNVIGRGGGGVVYMGRTRAGEAIAVKRLRAGGHDHGFRAEVRTLGSIRHRNIVRLLAFCTNQDTNVLVYEYMGNGSLGEVLHGKGGGFLGWDRRYRIAVEAARGLCYLHHDCSPMIVHRDVKSNNILLDTGFEAHVADFGLAKFLQDGGASESMSAIAGSYGYIAPEYAYTLKVDEKSDVYSFGVVLLELITGRRPVGEFGDGVDIVQWAKRVTDCSRDNVAAIADPRLSTVPIAEVMHVFFVAMLCVQENSVERPTMREVVQMLSEFPYHVPESHSPSSSATALKESSSGKKETGFCKLFPDLLT